jgi:hypothetical protein
VLALSLGGLRRRIEALIMPDDVIITLIAPPASSATAAGRRRGWRAEPPAIQRR